MLQAVINVSDGQDDAGLKACAEAAGKELLDMHSDRWHNRSVFTLAGDNLEESVFSLARTALADFDLASHAGAHPRLGILDVVPFVPFASEGLGEGASLTEANLARDAFAKRLLVKSSDFPVSSTVMNAVCRAFAVTRFAGSGPISDPGTLMHTRGPVVWGLGLCLIAYNLWLKTTDLDLAQDLARQVRSDAVRSLVFELGGALQLSMNLIAPDRVGPLQVYDQVSAITPIDRAELVGLIPERLLESIPFNRLAELDLGVDKTLEERLRKRR